MKAFVLALELLGTVAAFVAIWSIWAAQKRPWRILELAGFGIGPNRPPRWRSGPREYATLALAAVGLGLFAGGGAYLVLAWMPNSWGAADDEGGGLPSAFQ